MQLAVIRFAFRLPDKNMLVVFAMTIFAQSNTIRCFIPELIK